jgi:hypothetical protein
LQRYYRDKWLSQLFKCMVQVRDPEDQGNNFLQNVGTQKKNYTAQDLHHLHSSPWKHANILWYEKWLSTVETCLSCSVFNILKMAVTLGRVVSKKLMNVSEVLTASIIRVLIEPTPSNITEDRHLHTRHYEKLKSHLNALFHCLTLSLLCQIRNKIILNFTYNLYIIEIMRTFCSASSRSPNELATERRKAHRSITYWQSRPTKGDICTPSPRSRQTNF